MNISIDGAASRTTRSSERKPREERWAELLDAATGVFAEKGYDAASLQDIAERVGILKGSIYYYIDSKADLLAHLLRETHQTGLQNITEQSRGENDPLTRLFQMIVGHIFYVCSNLNKTAVFLREIRKLNSEQRAEILGDEHGYRRVFERVISEGLALGLIRSQVNPKLAAVCTLSSLNSIYTWYHEGGEFTPVEIAQNLSTSTLMGLATPKGVRILASLPRVSG